MNRFDLKLSSSATGPYRLKYEKNPETNSMNASPEFWNFPYFKGYSNKNVFKKHSLNDP